MSKYFKRNSGLTSRYRMVQQSKNAKTSNFPTQFLYISSQRDGRNHTGLPCSNQTLIFKQWMQTINRKKKQCKWRFCIRGVVIFSEMFAIVKISAGIKPILSSGSWLVTKRIVFGSGPWLGKKAIITYQLTARTNAAFTFLILEHLDIYISGNFLT